MKRKIYLTAFSVLGILLSFFVHAGVEIWYIGRLLDDSERWGLGLAWEQWEMIHTLGGVILFVGGAIFGFLQGRYWWRKIYQEGVLKKFGIRVNS